MSNSLILLTKNSQCIKSVRGVDAKLNVVVCKEYFCRDKFQLLIIKKFPTLFEEKMEISDGNFMPGKRTATMDFSVFVF